MKNLILILTILCFLMTSVFGPCPVYAQEGFRLPAPGVMVHLSPEFNPPILKGIKVHPDNPFRFDFILDQGDSNAVIPSPSSGIPSLSSVIPSLSSVIPAKAGILNQTELKQQATKLIKYFLASLTIPEKDLWVNLSPYEKDKIIPNSFGQTEMGRDLLAEDYMLKQITASLIYPEDEIGKKFWKRVYAEAQKKFGTTNIPVNTFNKVWIVPEKAVVYENAKAGTAYVVESKLKVMLEEDYLALSKNDSLPLVGRVREGGGINALGSQIIREIIIPELTREINEGKNFAQLRQVYNSLILATWYKKKIKNSILAQVYADKNKTTGVQYTSSVIPAKAGIFKNDVEGLYQEYLKAFKKGVYNYIKEDPIDGVIASPQGEAISTRTAIARKYFSGGFTANKILMDAAMTTTYILPEHLSVQNQQVIGVQVVAAQVLTDQLKGAALRQALNEEEIAALEKEIPAFNWRKASQVPWREVVHYLYSQPNGPSDDKNIVLKYGSKQNQQNYWDNNILARRQFLLLIKEMALNPGFDITDFIQRMSDMHYALRKGTGQTLYASDGGLDDGSNTKLIMPRSEQVELLFNMLKGMVGQKVDEGNLFSGVLQIVRFYILLMDYYLFGYGRGNNSLYMNMVNGLLRLYGLNGISHGEMDVYYIIIKNLDKRGVAQLFIKFLKEANPEVKQVQSFSEEDILPEETGDRDQLAPRKFTPQVAKRFLLDQLTNMNPEEPNRFPDFESEPIPIKSNKGLVILTVHVGDQEFLIHISTGIEKPGEVIIRRGYSDLLKEYYVETERQWVDEQGKKQIIRIRNRIVSKQTKGYSSLKQRELDDGLESLVRQLRGEPGEYKDFESQSITTNAIGQIKLWLGEIDKKEIVVFIATGVRSKGETIVRRGYSSILGEYYIETQRSVFQKNGTSKVVRTRSKIIPPGVSGYGNLKLRGEEDDRLESLVRQLRAEPGEYKDFMQVPCDTTNDGKIQLTLGVPAEGKETVVVRMGTGITESGKAYISRWSRGDKTYIEVYRGFEGPKLFINTYQLVPNLDDPDMAKAGFKKLKLVNKRIKDIKGNGSATTEPDNAQLSQVDQAIAVNISEGHESTYEQMPNLGGEHRYTRIPADANEARALYERISFSEEARKRYIKGLIGEIVKSGPGPLKFEDIDEEWKSLEAVTEEIVYHEGFLKDEHDVYWILKKKGSNPENHSAVLKNDKKREMLAYLLLKGIANFTEIRGISAKEAKDLNISESPDNYYLSRVVTQTNIEGILPHHERSQAFSALLVAHIFVRKDDPHPWNLAFVDNDVPVSIDEDKTILYNRFLASMADFKVFISKSFLFDSVVRPVMNFIAPKNLPVLWKDGTVAFRPDEELYLKFHLGIGYIRNEGLDKEYITQTIKAIKSMTNIRALAQEAGYSGQDLEDAVQYIESNQRHLGADVDFVWKDLTGESAGFQELDQEMKAGQEDRVMTGQMIAPNQAMLSRAVQKRLDGAHAYGQSVLLDYDDEDEKDFLKEELRFKGLLGSVVEITAENLSVIVETDQSKGAKEGIIYIAPAALAPTLEDMKKLLEVIGFDGYEGDFKTIGDVSAAQEQYFYNTNTDFLTGVNNRFGFKALVKGFIKGFISGDRERSKSLKMRVAFMDIDHFKAVNDIFGHGVGDAVLKKFAAYLKGSIRGPGRDSDIVARWGGEEFVLFFSSSEEKIRERLENILKVIREEIFKGILDNKAYVLESLGKVSPDNRAVYPALIFQLALQNKGLSEEELRKKLPTFEDAYKAASGEIKKEDGSNYIFDGWIVTSSMGTVGFEESTKYFPPGTEWVDKFIKAIVDEADKRLYAAKQAGRNRYRQGMFSPINYKFEDTAQDSAMTNNAQLTDQDQAMVMKKVSLQKLEEVGVIQGAKFEELMKLKPAGSFPSTIELIKNLYNKGAKIGVGSSNPIARQILSNLNIIKYFGTIVDGNEIKVESIPGKPSAEFFLAVANKMGIDPKECVVFEDAVAGVQSAKAGKFGLVIGLARLNDADQLREAKADIVVEDIKNLTSEQMERLESFSNVIFDLDGVIADTIPIHFEAWQVIMKEHFNEALTKEDFIKYMNGKTTTEAFKGFLLSRGFEIIDRDMQDNAQLTDWALHVQKKGGIDLTSAPMKVETKKEMASPEGIQFHLDPVLLAQLQNATGFVPVIIHVEPLKSLPEFLGLPQN